MAWALNDLFNLGTILPKLIFVFTAHVFIVIIIEKNWSWTQ